MATTDEKCSAAGGSEGRNSPIEVPHGDRRRRALAALAEQRAQLDRFEHDLAEQLQQLAHEVAQSTRLAEAAAAGAGESEALAALQSQYEGLKSRLAAVEAHDEQLGQQLEEARLQHSRLEQELRVREALLKESQANDEGRRVELATARERLADLEARLTAAHQRHGTLECELEEARQRLTDEREDTKNQRRRIAREFKQQRTAHLADLDRRKAELESLASSDHTQLEQQLAAAQSELLAVIRQAEELRHALAAREAELAEAHALAESLRQQPGGLAVDSQELATLRAERDDLTARLADAEARLSAQPASGDSQAQSDLQRRFEMAVEEVRELKRANADLENRLKSRPGSAAPAAPGGGLDWEAQKQRLLASLEADASDDDDEETVAERTSIEGTIRITDEIVAQKDEEIAELKQRLDSNSGSSAAAVAELLDSDEIIRQERERLVQAQEEWREKIGKAEIDISVERAKIARDRAELEEKFRQLTAEQDRLGGETAPDGTAKPTRGRWLARLGLKEMDEGK